MDCKKIHPIVILTVVWLPTSGAVLADPSSRPQRTDDLACNDLCHTWMEWGTRPDRSARPEQTVGSANPAKPRSSKSHPALPPSRIELAQTRAVARRPRQVAGRETTLPIPHVETAGPSVASARGRVATIVASDRMTIPALVPVAMPQRDATIERQGLSPAPTPTDIEPQQRPPLLPYPAPKAGPELEASVPVVAPDAGPVVQTVAAVRSESPVSPLEAEVATSAATGSLLLAMAALPLTPRRRRRGNPSLMATLRAEQRAVRSLSLDAVPELPPLASRTLSAFRLGQRIAWANLPALQTWRVDWAAARSDRAHWRPDGSLSEAR